MTHCTFTFPHIYSCFCLHSYTNQIENASITHRVLRLKWQMEMAGHRFFWLQWKAHFRLASSCFVLEPIQTRTICAIGIWFIYSCCSVVLVFVRFCLKWTMYVASWVHRVISLLRQIADNSKSWWNTRVFLLQEVSVICWFLIMDRKLIRSLVDSLLFSWWKRIIFCLNDLSYVIDLRSFLFFLITSQSPAMVLSETFVFLESETEFSHLVTRWRFSLNWCHDNYGNMEFNRCTTVGIYSQEAFPVIHLFLLV